MLEQYVRQVRLLLSVLPDIAKEPVFALKGGTAINLFYRDMPRVSVDIDLTYLPVADRESSLDNIDASLDRIARAITVRNPRVKAQRIAGGGINDTRILVSDGQAQIKIETSPVTRGAVYPARLMVASEAVTERFGFVEMNVLAFQDLYGGELHAALDRQHPRDLFDVKLLYENEGLTDDLFRVLMVYVASSGRPMHELLAPSTPLREDLFRAEFLGMTQEAVPADALVGARRRLHADIRSRLKGEVANFLLSLHDADPDFAVIGLPDAANLPAIRWKIVNLEKLKRANPEKRMAQRDALESLFQ
ncbi:MAG: nucleotidyl transferase AbiEii/AbiGii toxin family protein [Acidobacteriia bacterium]|nr:nucleotidyl transferase AbiEii/AbiGii toxin family protein [Terriglobia bacterium]MYK09030.1 nucleotidyl transferase AbiEii/AbiGii toxin family protein [Terriglobia bacterium]